MSIKSHSTKLLVVGMAAVGAALHPASAQQAPPALPVTVAQPLAKQITNWDEFSGRFEAVQTVEVRARVSGFIDKIHFKDGQIIRAGDPLFTIDQKPFVIALDVAKAEINRSQAQVKLQEAEVERATPLVRSRTVTEREFETRQANLGVARAQLQSAEANAKSAELNLEWTVVWAPIAGRISDRKVDVGNLVVGGQANTTLLTTIVSIDPIHFVFDVSEADFLRYARLFIAGERPTSREVSNPVRIKLADENGWSRLGRMNFVDNQLNPRSGTLRGRAIVDNKDNVLAPGLFGRLQLFGGDEDALLIPDGAVVSDQTRKIVFAVGPDNVIKAVPVKLGAIVDGLRVVREGLNRQDRIVIDGLANPLVRPGAKVAPQMGEIKSAAN